jgi:hypothetical protein
MSRRVASMLMAALSAAAVVAVPPFTARTADAAAQLQPDLGMAKLSDLHVENASQGEAWLRFSATVVNVGAGQLEVRASRATTTADFDVSQRTFNSDGSHSDHPVAAKLVFAGDGHSHWHVKDLAAYELERLDNGVKVGTSAKGGFCFFDTTAYRLSLPGAPQEPVYGHAGCGTQTSVALTMGISVGWGDRYGWLLPDQYIDITGLSNGKYRLRATANKAGLFSESNGGNNSTWVDIQLSTRKGTTSVKVLKSGPAA